MTTGTTIEQFKEFSQKYWSKKSTGISVWGGFVKTLMYAPHKGGRIRYYKDVTVDRRRALPGSDVGRSWWDFDLNHCFRMDMYNMVMVDCKWRGPKDGPILTLKNLNELQPTDERQWANPDWFSNYKETTPVIEPFMEGMGAYFIGSDFSWMYRTWLQNFFLLNAVEQYDIEKGVKLVEPQPMNQPVWINPNKPSTIKPIVPYEPVTNPNVVVKPPPLPPTAPAGEEEVFEAEEVEEEVKEEAEEEAEEKVEVEEEEKVSEPGTPPPAVEPPKVSELQDEPEILLPLLTIMDIEIGNTVKDFMDCLDKKQNLQQKRQSLCKEYNDLLEESIRAQSDRYQTQSFQMHSHLREEIETLKALCDRYQSQRNKTTEVAQTISRLKAKGTNVHNIKNVSGTIPPIALEQGATKQKAKEDRKSARKLKEAKRKLKLLIDEMKSICNVSLLST